MSSLSRDRINRLKRQAAGHLESFELGNGSRYYYDRMQAGRELYIYAHDQELGRDPEPPEVWRKIHQARDPESVLASFRAPNSHSPLMDLDELYATERIEK